MKAAHLASQREDIDPKAYTMANLPAARFAVIFQEEGDPTPVYLCYCVERPRVNYAWWSEQRQAAVVFASRAKAYRAVKCLMGTKPLFDHTALKVIVLPITHPAFAIGS